MYYTSYAVSTYDVIVYTGRKAKGSSDIAGKYHCFYLFCLLNVQMYTHRCRGEQQ